jgi:membrane-bound lytic murein transglycosylase D
MGRLMKRYAAVATTLGAAFAVAAWAGEPERPRTVPAPVDVMLEEAVSAVGEAPEAIVRSVRLASAEPVATVRTEWDLPKTYNERVQYWIDFLAGRNRDRTQLWLEREGRYGDLIRSRLRERGMPEDLLYLGMIESGLSPRAYSRAHAAGMWQFISETGQRYGLEVTGFVDERRDPVKATDAALDYLSELYERFGSWYLAAAAYNSGENRVERILRQRAGGRKGDEALFWQIDRYLPRETRDYVPLMLAAGHIGKEPAKYGFHEVALQSPLAYDEVRVPGGVTLSAVASAAGVSTEDVTGLNAHLVRGMTPPGRAWAVRVPEGAGERLAASVDRLEKESRASLVTHRVRRGETLSHIARRYGIDVATLRASNGNLNPRRIQVGQRIQVPVGAGARAAARTASSNRTTWTTYRVRRGDSLWGIARRHGVTVTQLRRWNGIGNRIYPGQRIKIAA